MESVHSNSAELQSLPQEMSLWPCVHDADLLAIASDLLDRSLTLSLRVFYINSFHHLAENTVFHFVMKDVFSVSATNHNPWPGPSDIPASLPWEEQHRLGLELHDKGRQESVSWAKVEDLMASNDVEIMNGQLTGRHSLTLEANFHDSDYLHLNFKCVDIRVLQGDKKSMDVSEFLAMGEAYWEAFAARKINTLEDNA